MFSISEYKKFYKELVDDKNDFMKIHCSALFVGETMIATHVGILDIDTFYYLMPAHEVGEWEKFSPGRLLLENLIEWSIENNLKIFDFTIGEEHYKKIWCDTETKIYETLEANNIKGKIYIFVQHIIHFLKRRQWLIRKARILNIFLKGKIY